MFQRDLISLVSFAITCHKNTILSPYAHEKAGNKPSKFYSNAGTVASLGRILYSVGYSRINKFAIKRKRHACVSKHVFLIIMMLFIK